MTAYHISANEIEGQLLYIFFTLFTVSYALKSTKYLRKIQQSSVEVPAMIMGYSTTMQELSYKLKRKLHHVNIICKDPRTGKLTSFNLVTRSSQGEKYSRYKTAIVLIQPDSQGLPMLPEEIELIKRSQAFAVIGAVVCIVFLLLMGLALLDDALGGNISSFLHEQFIS